MNEVLYEQLIEDKFEQWLGTCKYLVADFERFLRSGSALAALKRLGIQMVERSPSTSQDFNAIENCWATLKERLFETQPTGFANVCMKSLTMSAFM